MVLPYNGILKNTKDTIFAQTPLKLKTDNVYSRQSDIKKSESPNKIANVDFRFSNKVAWYSTDLLERQNNLVTYSADIATIFDCLVTIVSAILCRKLQQRELEFIINFGSPIVDNSHKISVGLRKPVDLQIKLIRTLVDSKVIWSTEVSTTEYTPTMVDGKFVDLTDINGEIAVTPAAIVENNREIVQERKSRKVKI